MTPSHSRHCRRRCFRAIVYSPIAEAKGFHILCREALGEAVWEALWEAFGEAIWEALGEAFGKRQESLCEAVAEARGEAFWEALGEALGQALWEALGEAFAEAHGEAFWEALGEAVGKRSGSTLGSSPLQFSRAASSVAGRGGTFCLPHCPSEVTLEALRKQSIRPSVTI